MNEDKFWSKVDIREADDCWLWKAGKDSDGYGAAWHKGKQQKAHRLAYEFTYGNTPGALVLHTCDTPACCNPKHLYDGTHHDNALDNIKRGKHILSRRQVDEIRTKYTGKYGEQTQLATVYNVDRTTIHNIVNFKAWK